MSLVGLSFYMDHHVPRAVSSGLRLRGVDVLTAFEDGASSLSDNRLLDRASTLGRVLFTQDDDLLAVAAERHAEGGFFSGLIYAHQLRVSVGRCVRDLEILAKACRAEELINTVLFLPL